MTESETTFWSAIVQIIPVILLALVVEARFLKVDRKRIKRIKKRARERYQTNRWMRSLYLSWWTSLDRGYIGATVMLVIALSLFVSEATGLWALMHDAAPTGPSDSIALVGTLVGVLAVAVLPVVGRYVKTHNDSTPALPNRVRAAPNALPPSA